MTGGTDTGINHYGHGGLIDDNLQEVLHAQTFIRTDGGSQGHHRGSTGLFQVLAQRRVGLTIGEYNETEFYQLFGGFQGFNGVGQQIAGVGVNLELEPVGAKGLACHLGGKDRLLGIAHTRRVGQQLDVGKAGDVGE